MVRIYFPPRFTKKNMGPVIAEKAMNLFEGAGVFNKSKVIHSTACYLNKDD
jgi:hypothetical protein